MTQSHDPDAPLRPQHQKELSHAVKLLERPTFAARLADYAGKPVNEIIKLMPGPINRQFQGIVRIAILQCLETAVESLENDEPAPPSDWTGKVMTGLTGGVGGFFGLAALPIELPLTTTLMLRSIAEIARDYGEDLTELDARLACVEVFALGGRSTADVARIDYYAVRAVLSRLMSDVARQFAEFGVVNASSPVITRLVGEIMGRFGLAVSDRLAASAAPILGAVGGATVNMVFMDHFQRIARGHFAIRRLERTYGAPQIEALYHHAARELNNRTRMPSPPPQAARK
ncbi:EcsC family protein [Aquabacter sp. CN5-332]|uniref:EcsC family protein n=1 Tax=Aquabacter sp. CN5-332 TaxID=3156608 RepID=UPI0032B60042